MKHTPEPQGVRVGGLCHGGPERGSNFLEVTQQGASPDLCLLSSSFTALWIFSGCSLLVIRFYSQKNPMK